MYLPESFKETRLYEIKKIIESFPLATLVTWSDRGLDANHLPFLVDFGASSIQRIRGHIAKKNPLYGNAKDGMDVLIIYRAEDSYISPNWYPTKALTQQAVPTWNYQAVHIYGKIQFTEDPKFIRGVVAQLTKEHERNIGEADPWKLSNAPSTYIDEMISSVVGIEVDVDTIEAKSKLSQNKAEVDFDGVREKLHTLNRRSIAHAMDSLKLEGES